MKFRKIIISFLCVICLVLNVSGARVQAAGFKDVTPKTSGYDAIMWASSMGIINGYSDGTFRPKDPITRASTAVMIWRLYDKPAASDSGAFTDIGDYSNNVQTAINWCYQQGYVKGTGDGTTFNPGGYLTREQMVVILHRMTDELGTVGITTPFKDISGCSAGIKRAIAWAYTEEVTKGTSSTTFGPKQNCTRAQFCIFLNRFCFRPYSQWFTESMRTFNLKTPAMYMLSSKTISDNGGYGDYDYWVDYTFIDPVYDAAAEFSVVSGSYGIGGEALMGSTHVRITKNGYHTDYYYHTYDDKISGWYWYKGENFDFSGPFSTEKMTTQMFFLIMNQLEWTEPEA